MLTAPPTRVAPTPHDTGNSLYFHVSNRFGAGIYGVGFTGELDRWRIVTKRSARDCRPCRMRGPVDGPPIAVCSFRCRTEGLPWPVRSASSTPEDMTSSQVASSIPGGWYCACHGPICSPRCHRDARYHRVRQRRSPRVYARRTHCSRVAMNSRAARESRAPGDLHPAVAGKADRGSAGQPTEPDHTSNDEEKSGRRDSNPRPAAWEAATLPLSYSRSGARRYRTGR